MTSQNPIQRVMNEKGISPSDLAILAGVQRSGISHLLKGYAAKLSGRVLDALVEIGCDGEQLVKEYAAWREAKAEEVRKQFA